MGLDMYLHAKRYFSKHLKTDTGKQEAIIAQTGKIGVCEDYGVEVQITAAYWRKANAIHKWFVDNVQDGEDDCGDYYVSQDQLRELRDLCQQVLDVAKTKKAKIHTSTSWSNGKETKNYEEGSKITNADEIHELLPTQEGFFFGGTEYNNFYLDDCRDTIKKIDAILNDPNVKDWSFEYHSSW